MKNWQTTVQAILTCTMVGTTSLLAMNTLPPKWTAVALSVQGLAKAFIGVMQKDAGAK